METDLRAEVLGKLLAREGGRLGALALSRLVEGLRDLVADLGPLVDTVLADEETFTAVGEGVVGRRHAVEDDNEQLRG